MTDEDIDKLVKINQRLLLVMGYGTSVMMELGKHLPHDKKDGVNWYFKAVQNIVYLDQPLPPMP